MTKYGYNDTAWLDEIKSSGARFNSAVRIFNLDGYMGMMKRKTVTEDELKSLKALTEMVELLNEHMKNLPVKG